MSFTRITGPGISSYPVIAGIITALNFKSGTTNIHSAGVEAAGINVLGGDTPIGTGATIFKDGSVRFGHTGNNNTGIVTANKVDAPTITATTVTATTFSGDGSNLTSLPAGLGTALSSTQTSPLNKLYYTDNVLSIGATITVDPPPSSSGAYTQYTDIVVQDTADLIVGDGDDLIPDVLGLSTETATTFSATGGRIRAGTFTNAAANGAPTATNGWIVTGVSTATTFKGALTGDVTGNVTGNVSGNVTGNISGGTVAGSTGTFSSNVTIDGNLGVAGTITYEDVARVDATGISTFREGLNIGPLAGIAATYYSDGSIRSTGIITATSFSGSGANLTSIPSAQLTGALPAIDGSALTGVGVGTADSINTSGIITATAFIPSVGNLGGRNLLINGDCQINQRHGVGGNVTGLTNGAAQFGADRWELKITNPSGGTWAFNHTDTSYEPGGFRRSIQCALTGTAQATSAAETLIYIRQQVEARNAVRLAWGNASKKSMTLSFWMNCNVAGNGQVNIQHGDANVRVSGVYTYSNAGSWQKQTITFPGSDNEINNDNGTGFRVEWVICAGADAKTGAVRTTWTTPAEGDRAAGHTINIATTVGHKFAITGIQLEEGSVATPYEHRSYGEELARCQRYYTLLLKGNGGSDGTGNPQLSIGYVESSSVIIGCAQLPVQMRATPSIEHTSGSNYWEFRGGGTTTTISSAMQASSQNNISWGYAFTSASGLTSGHAGRFSRKGDNIADRIFAAKAEL